MCTLLFINLRTYAAKRLKPCSSAIHRRPDKSGFKATGHRSQPWSRNGRPMNRATTIEVRKS